MKAIIEFFNAYSFDILGYTLLHSVWQGLIIAIIIGLILRGLPSKLSSVRYVFATAGLFSIVVASLVTIFLLASEEPNEKLLTASDQTATSDQVSNIAITFNNSPTFTPLLTAAQNFVEKCMPIFLILWVAGALFFGLRIFIGLAYVDRLREESIPLGNEWSSYIQKISTRLKIEKFITLAESSAIEAPVVIGYVKPFILIPLGLCTSLSTAQLETIFIHELMHIRRKDYLVNLIQSFVEAVYFFNPFVWIISNMVKRERELCCDDAVVELHGNTAAYASALAALEEARLSGAALSLSLVGSKNELLKRIKRLMEKSVHPHYSNGKIIPAVLLVIGVICASWISATTGPTGQDIGFTHNATVVQDTTKKNKKAKAARKAENKRASTNNEEVEIDKEVDVAKEIEVEEPLEAEVEENLSYAPPVPDFDIPPIPDVAGMIPPMVDLELLMQDFEAPHFDWNDKDWEKFSQEFEEKFRSKFGDFYEKNESDIQKMLDEIQQNLNNNFGEDFEATMQDFSQKHEQWARDHAEKLALQAEKMALHGDHIEKLGEDMQKFGENFHEEFEKHHKEFEKQHKEFEKKTRNFENALREELTKDGYLDAGEKLKEIEIYNGVLKINGQQIKPEHQKKYDELREKHFPNPGSLMKKD